VKRSKIFIPYAEIKERLTTIMRGRVLHMTCNGNLQSILSAGEISGNADGRFASSFGGSRDGYFRKRNAVSVFDYRHSVPDSEFESAWGKCGAHTALHLCNFRIVLMFLSEEFFDHLISWKEWSLEEAWEEMLVPFVEAGYPAPLPLSAIEEIIEVHTRYNPSPLEKALAAQ
jgi:hypothetical protein